MAVFHVCVCVYLCVGVCVFVRACVCSNNKNKPYMCILKEVFDKYGAIIVLVVND